MQKFKIGKKLREELWGRGKMVEHELATPDGTITTFIRRESNDVATVIPFLDEKRVVMVRQYRFGPDAISLEFPKGRVDEGNLQEAALRELKEETGYVATAVEPIGSFVCSPAIATQREYVFVARSLTPGVPHTEEDEIIEVEHIALSDIPKLIKTGEIFDAGTICAYYLWQSSRE